MRTFDLVLYAYPITPPLPDTGLDQYVRIDAVTVTNGLLLSPLQVIDESVYLVYDNTNVISSNLAVGQTLQGPEITVEYTGSTADLSGTTSEVFSPGFGVALRFLKDVAVGVRDMHAGVVV